MALQYLHLAPYHKPPDVALEPTCLVIIADEEVGDEWRNEIARWIVSIGSLYAVAWGVECEQWHDSVDWANLEKFDYADIPDENFIMTTWHSDETLAEAFWFAGNCAFHPTIELTRTLLLHIDLEAREESLIAEYHAGQNSEPDD